MSLDTSVGTTTSQSYASVAEADAYLTFRGGTAAWFLLTQAAKEQLLQWACVQIDTLFFVGVKTILTQALEWPRFQVTDKNGYWIPGNVIPAQLKNAQIEMAFQLNTTDWSQGLNSVESESIKVGSVEQGRKTYRAFPAAVVALLKQFLTTSPNSGGRAVRG